MEPYLQAAGQQLQESAPVSVRYHGKVCLTRLSDV